MTESAEPPRQPPKCREKLGFDDLNQTLDKSDVPGRERSELLALVESTGDEIVRSTGARTPVAFGTPGGRGRTRPRKIVVSATRRESRTRGKIAS
jgi:hypothetical protein